MTALDILLNLIKESEGCRLETYLDTGNVPTIGWGCTGKNIKIGDKITQQQADDMLKDRASQSLKEAFNSSPMLLKESVSKQAAIADFIYNMGARQYQKSTLKKFVDIGDWVHAKEQILRWNKDNGKVLKGLTIRRQKEAALMDA